MEEKKKGARLGEVTMVKDCMICHEEQILIATKDQRQPLPPKDSILPQVCEECTKKYLKEGILIVNPNTGKLAVLKEEAFVKIFSGVDTKKALEMRVCFAEEQVLDMLLRGHEK